MPIYDKNGQLIQTRVGRKPGAEDILIKVRYSTIAKLFNCRSSTIKRWNKEGLLNPFSLQDIVNKYNNRELLDRRRKRKDQ